MVKKCRKVSYFMYIYIKTRRSILRVTQAPKLTAEPPESNHKVVNCCIYLKGKHKFMNITDNN